jgi:mercuric ion binding protein
MQKTLFAGVAVALVSASALAAPQTVTLEVSRMACPLCPITVRKALEKVDGVVKADVSFDKKEAVVTFDDAKTNEQELMKATRNAGFPSSIKPK